MAKNKDVAVGREPAAAAAAAEAQEGSSPSPRPTRPGPARPVSASRLRQGSENERHGRAGRERVRERLGRAGEGGLPTSDPADGGHMAAASQIKRLRLGGSAITAV